MFNFSTNYWKPTIKQRIVDKIIHIIFLNTKNKKSEKKLTFFWYKYSYLTPEEVEEDPTTPTMQNF